jgi:hypothetical protein
MQWSWRSTKLQYHRRLVTKERTGFSRRHLLKPAFFLKTKTIMIYLLFLVALLLISCNQDQAKDNSKDEIIEYFIPLSHRVEKDVDEMFEEYRYVPLETRDDALIDVLYKIRNIALFQEDIYIGSDDILIAYDKSGKIKRVLSKKGEDPQSYFFLGNFTIWPNGDILISSSGDVTTYSNSFKFIRKWSDHENIGLIEAIILFNDSSYIIKCTPTERQLRYRIINHKNGTYISTYDSIEKQNKYISSFTNSFERFEGLIISHGYQGNEILECTMDSTKVRYRINIDNKIPPAGFWAQDGKDYVQIVMEEAEKGYIGHIPDYVESKETILLSFKGKRDDLEGVALIDKKDGNARVLENIKFDDNFRWLPKQFFSLDEGWCAMLMYPEDVLKKEEFARRFPGLNEESNPVLFIGKLR